MSDRERSRTTVCPLCAVGCHLARGEGDRAAGRAGPANPEGRLCRKGVRAFDVLDDEDRLTTPLVREDGDLVAVSWERALDTAVAGLKGVIETAGPDALAFLGAPHCTNEENYLLQKLARILGTNNVDNRARLCHESTAATLRRRVGWPATTNTLDDIGDADLLLVVGANPAERQPVAFNSFVRPAVNDGTMLVHVDPVGNRTTRLADVHLAPRPGRDALVLDLLSATVLDADGVADPFVEERTRGFEGFVDGLAAMDRERAVSTAGVEPAALREVGAMLAGADRTAALVGTGIEGGEGAVPASDALLNLLLVTGNLGRRGTGVFVLRGLVNEQGATDAGCVPDRLPGHQPVSDPDARARVADVWGVEVPAEPGRTARASLEAFGDAIRGALVVGENPAISKRDPAWLRDRLDGLDTLVVAEIAHNETTAHADVVLPAGAGVEKAGTVTNLDRQVQRFRPTATPPGRARPDFAILRALGRRLAGDRGHFEYAGPEAAFEELTRVAPTHAGGSYAAVGAEGGRWPFDGDAVLYQDRFDTEDGRAPFVRPDPAVGAAEASGLHLVTGGRASEFQGEHTTADGSIRLHPADAERRGIGPETTVEVSNGEATIEVTAEIDEAVREGTAYLPAQVADPLLRGETSTVAVERVSRPTDTPE